MLEKSDYERILSLMKSKVSLHYLQKDMPWMKLWDLARDHDAHGRRAIQAVIKVLTTSAFLTESVKFAMPLVPRTHTMLFMWPSLICL